MMERAGTHPSRKGPFVAEDGIKAIKELVEEIVADGKLTKAEMKRFDEAVLADGRLTVEERKLIGDIMAMIERGELKVVDE